MTTNYRVRKSHPNRRRAKSLTSLFGFGDWAVKANAARSMPRITKEQLKKLRHGDTFYRGRVGYEGVYIEEFRVLDRPRPISAYTKRSVAMKKDYEDRLRTCYVLHARDNGARPGYEYVDFPMTRKERVRYANNDSTLPMSEPRLVTSSAASFMVKRAGRDGVPQHLRSPHQIEVIETERSRPVVTSITQFLADEDDRLTVQRFKWTTGRLNYLGDIRTGFIVWSKRRALRLAKELLSTNYGSVWLKEEWDQEQSDRNLDAMRDAYEDAEEFGRAFPYTEEDAEAEEESEYMIAAYTGPEPEGPDSILNDPIFDVPAKETGLLTDQQMRALGVEE